MPSSAKELVERCIAVMNHNGAYEMKRLDPDNDKEPIACQISCFSGAVNLAAFKNFLSADATKEKASFQMIVITKSSFNTGIPNSIPYMIRSVGEPGRKPVKVAFVFEDGANEYGEIKNEQPPQQEEAKLPEVETSGEADYEELSNGGANGGVHIEEEFVDPRDPTKATRDFLEKFDRTPKFMQFRGVKNFELMKIFGAFKNLNADPLPDDFVFQSIANTTRERMEELFPDVEERRVFKNWHLQYIFADNELEVEKARKVVEIILKYAKKYDGQGIKKADYLPGLLKETGLYKRWLLLAVADPKTANKRWPFNGGQEAKLYNRFTRNLPYSLCPKLHTDDDLGEAVFYGDEQKYWKKPNDRDFAEFYFWRSLTMTGMEKGGKARAAIRQILALPGYQRYRDLLSPLEIYSFNDSNDLSKAEPTGFDF